jgi:hypothetical protein
MVPAWPGAAFEVVQAERALELAIVLFDAPAQLAEADQFHQRRGLGEVRQPVLDRLGLVGRPLGQQPTQGQFPPAAVGPGGSLAAGVIPAGRTRNARKRERCRPLLARRQISSMPAWARPPRRAG